MNRTSRINENFGLKTLGILGMSLWFLIIMMGFGMAADKENFDIYAFELLLVF